MDPENRVSNLINCLTNDEDKRQELWVHYLSGNSVTTLATYLDKINIEYSIDTNFQEQLWSAFKNPPSDKFQELLNHLTPVEQSIACLLALGLSTNQISKYKGISEVRIRQVIRIIGYNSVWSELYGFKEATD